jgi:hypothetical protein
MAVIIGLDNRGTPLARAYENVIANGSNLRSSALSMLSRYDQNDDGLLTPDELTVSTSTFRALDSSSDGAVDLTELRRMYSNESRLTTQGRMIQQIFAHRDVDGDGFLSREEFAGTALGYDRIDANRDGGVTPAEVRRQLKKFLDADEERGPSLSGGGGNVQAGTLATPARATEKVAYLRGAFEASELGHSVQRRIVGAAEKGGPDVPPGLDRLEKPRA